MNRTLARRLAEAEQAAAWEAFRAALAALPAERRPKAEAAFAAARGSHAPTAGALVAAAVAAVRAAVPEQDLRERVAAILAEAFTQPPAAGAADTRTEADFLTLPETRELAALVASACRAARLDTPISGRAPA